MDMTNPTPALAELLDKTRYAICGEYQFANGVVKRPGWYATCFYVRLRGMGEIRVEVSDVEHLSDAQIARFVIERKREAIYEANDRAAKIVNSTLGKLAKLAKLEQGKDVTP